ncbi:MAG: hypothetical protein Q9160_005113 [Pyrenula sp. 1 TL-2023]
MANVEDQTNQITPTLPTAIENNSFPMSGQPSPSASSSSSSLSDNDDGRVSRTTSRSERASSGWTSRPKMGPRKPSGSIIIPKNNVETELQNEDYPPDDARAMSPRRESADLERLGHEARQALKDQAKTLQSSLAALAERIDEVKSDHDKLESENKFLQDYIGGLTRTMSKSELSSTSGSKSKK